MHACFKIYCYFEFNFFTYHLSSVVDSATLKVHVSKIKCAFKQDILLTFPTINLAGVFISSNRPNLNLKSDMTLVSS